MVFYVIFGGRFKGIKQSCRTLHTHPVFLVLDILKPKLSLADIFISTYSMFWLLNFNACLIKKEKVEAS